MRVVGRERGVGMEKHYHVPSCGFGPLVHLSGAAGLPGSKHSGASPAGLTDRVVEAVSVNDDHFDRRRAR